MRPPCDLGLTDGHFNISAAKLCIMLNFSRNLEKTCICISSMIMTQLSIFSVSEEGKTSSQWGWHASTPSNAILRECPLTIWDGAKNWAKFVISPRCTGNYFWVGWGTIGECRMMGCVIHSMNMDGGHRIKGMVSWVVIDLKPKPWSIGRS